MQRPARETRMPWSWIIGETSGVGAACAKVPAIGNSSGKATGVLLVGPIAGALCLTSAFVYALYPERRVLAARLALEVPAAQPDFAEEPSR
jgi:hypothetical protein